MIAVCLYINFIRIHVFGNHFHFGVDLFSSVEFSACVSCVCVVMALRLTTNEALLTLLSHLDTHTHCALSHLSKIAKAF